MASSASEGGLERTLALAASGDGQAWRELVEAYSRRVFGLLARQCGDRDLAEELTQATFVQVVTHLGRYREQGQFEPWLFRIAMNQLRDEMRRRKRQAKNLSVEGEGGAAWEAGLAGNRDGASRGDGAAGPFGRMVDRTGTQPGSPLESISRDEQVALLKQAIEQLSEADREILHLRHTAGLSFAEIAQTLDQPLGTVLARGHRALAKLRKMLEEA